MLAQKLKYPALEKSFVFYVFMEAIALNAQKRDRSYCNNTKNQTTGSNRSL